MGFDKVSICKFLELAITCACVGLHYKSFNSEVDLGMLVTGTFVGYLIILAGGALGYIVQAPSHKRVNQFFCVVGIALFIACGGMLIDRYQHQYKSENTKLNLAKGSLAIVNAAIFLIDGVLTIRD